MKISLSPSAAARWLTCTASPQYIVENNLRAPYKKYAADGATDHDIAADHILSGKVVKLDAKDPRTFSIKDYVDYIQGLPKGFQLVEQKVPNFYGVGNSILDYINFHDNSMHIVDFKSGWTLVPTEGNPQLMIYALNAVKAYGFVVGRPRKTIIQIYQPPKRYYDAVEVSKDQLDCFEQEVKVAVKDIKDKKNLKFQPSVDACKWCPGKQLATCKHWANFSLQ